MTAVMVACPSNRGISGPTVESLIATVGLLEEIGHRVIGGAPTFMLGCSSIDLARNTLLRNPKALSIAAKVNFMAEEGDVLRIESPGGGGWGKK